MRTDLVSSSELTVTTPLNETHSALICLVTEVPILLLQFVIAKDGQNFDLSLKPDQLEY